MTDDMIYTTDGTPEYVITLFPKGFKGICVDIGAYDPLWSSNSWIFEQVGWECYCIEPNHKCIPRLKQYRKNVLEYACGDTNRDNVNFYVYNVSEWLGEAAGTGLIDHCKGRDAEYHKTIFSRIDKVKERTLDWLMENEIKRDHVDYLSIDVERNEMNVLKGTDLRRWKPKVICIENLENVEPQHKWLKEFDYRYVYRIAVNDFYIQNDYYTLIVS